MTSDLSRTRGCFRRPLDLALIVLFLAAIGAPVLRSLWGHSEFDPGVEKRQIAPFPSLRDMRAFPAGFERWFGDRFGFRRQLVHAQSMLKLRLGVSPSKLVLVGRDGWFFYLGERAIESFRRTAPLSQVELQTWRDRLTARRRWLEARGIHYLVVIAPSKESVYPDRLPAWIAQGVDASVASRREQLVEALQSSGVEALDLGPTLVAARETDRLYHLTDTHWNDRGAFVAYRAIAQRLARWFPCVDVMNANDVVLAQKWTLGGDLAGMMDLREDLRELALLTTPRSPHAVVLATGIPVAPGTPAHAIPQARGRGGRVLPGAIILRDSFGDALIPFLSENLSRGLYLFTHDLDPEVVDRERPGVVIDLMLERFLMMAPFENRPEIGASVAKAPSPKPSP